MKIADTPAKTSRKLSAGQVFVYSLIVIVPFAIQSFADSAHKPIGKPFGDPSYIVPMPESWKKQPIKYNPSLSRADIVITLDQHLYPALMPSIEKYGAEKGLTIIVSEGTCGISDGKLQRKEVDIGGFCCPPGRTDRLPGLRFHTIGIAAVALLVHSANPVDNVTSAQARKIFAGDIRRWSELKAPGGRPGPDGPIQPIGRLHCKPRPGHWRLLLDNEDLFGPNLREVGAIVDMLTLVAGNPTAVGYEALWNLHRFNMKEKIKPLSIDGYPADDPSHLLSGEYPLYRTYNITTWEGENIANPSARKLVDNLLREADNLDAEFGIVPASALRKAGWKFKDNELIGGPQKNPL